MAAYRKIPATGNVDLDRVNQAVAEAFAALPDAPVSFQAVTIAKDYAATGSEGVIHVDASAGPVRVTLPKPSTTMAPLVVKQVNLSKSPRATFGGVTVVAAGATSTIAGASSFALDGSGTGSVTFTSDGQQHWPGAAAGGNPSVTPTPPPAPPYVPPPSVTFVPLTRRINTIPPLFGGGDLSADLTLGVTLPTVYYQFVDDPSVGTQPQRGHLGFGERVGTLVTDDDAGNDRTNVELATVAGNPFDTGAANLPGRLITNAFGQVTLANSITVGSGLLLSGGVLSATAGGGSVTAVSATAPLFITGGASPTPNVVIHGGVTTGGTSTAVTSLGALASGVLQQSVTASVSTPSVFAAGAARIPFGSGTAGGLTDDGSLTASITGGLGGVGTGVTIANTSGASTPGFFVTNTSTNTGAAAVSRWSTVAGAASNYVQQGILGGSFGAAGLLGPNVALIEHNSTANMLIGNVGGGDLIIESTGSRVERLRVTSAGAVNVASLSAGGLVKAAVTSGTLAIASAADVAGAITWPTAAQVLISAGTALAPLGDTTYTFDRVAHVQAAGNAVGINGVGVPSNASLAVGVTTAADRDRVQFFVGGGALGATGTGDNTLFDINPGATAIRAGVTGGIYATQRIRAISYSGSSVAIAEAATLYLDGPPSIGGGISVGSFPTLHVAAGQTKLGGNLTMAILVAGGAVAVDTTGTVGIAGVGGLPPAVSAEQHYFIAVTGSTLVTGANVFLATSSAAGFAATAIEYEHSFAASTVSLKVHIIANAITSGTLAIRLTRNGSTFSTLTLNNVSSGTVTTGSLTVGSPTASDQWGVAANGTGTGMSGSMQFTATLLAAPNVF